MLHVLPLALATPNAVLYGAVVAGVVAIVNSAVGRKNEHDDRRREQYAGAYRAALEWCEAVYRVRRRNPDGSQDHDIVERLHDLQERIAFYEGWLSTESESLGRAYGDFLRAVLAECEPLLKDAWSRLGRPPTEPKPEDEKSPDLSDAKAAFCEAVRRHMRPWWNPPDLDR
jgi:hypothetical protein